MWWLSWPKLIQNTIYKYICYYVLIGVISVYAIYTFGIWYIISSYFLQLIQYFQINDPYLSIVRFVLKKKTFWFSFLGGALYAGPFVGSFTSCDVRVRAWKLSYWPTPNFVGSAAISKCKAFWQYYQGQIFFCFNKISIWKTISN